MTLESLAGSTSKSNEGSPGLQLEPSGCNGGERKTVCRMSSRSSSRRTHHNGRYFKSHMKYYKSDILKIYKISFAGER